MGGEIKVVKKNGPGTLMRFYLLLNTTGDGAEHHCQVDFARHNVVVSLPSLKIKLFFQCTIKSYGRYINECIYHEKN